MTFDLVKAIDNPFCNMEKEKVYVFGTGRYAHKFISMYRNNCKIVCALDNDLNKWGESICGYEINKPDTLLKEKEEYKVIICAKEYKDILQQLLNMGISNVGIYDATKVYEGRQNRVQGFKPYESSDDVIDFPEIGHYKVGYVAGVFDLFHIGHLNLLRRAKMHCDYLVVGVVSDEQVRRNKNKEPFIPFSERLEIVRGCKYVDEANEIPIDYSGTVEAFEKYHFDVQFSGSDYVNDSWWLSQQEYLRKNGADLIFFPYTASTSSTMIQKVIASQNTEGKCPKAEK